MTREEAKKLSSEDVQEFFDALHQYDKEKFITDNLCYADIKYIISYVEEMGYTVT